MRRAIAATLIIGLSLPLAAQVARAQRPKLSKRVVKESYVRPSTSVATDDAYVGNCNPTPLEEGQGCLYFDLKPKDRFITLNVEDATGRPVYAIAWDDSDSDFVEFCGKTNKRVPSPGGDYFYVEVIATSSRLGCYPSTVTQGEVTATIHQAKK